MKLEFTTRSKNAGSAKGAGAGKAAGKRKPKSAGRAGADVVINPFYAAGSSARSNTKSAPRLGETTFSQVDGRLELAVALGRSTEKSSARTRQAGGMTAQSLIERGISRAVLNADELISEVDADIIPFLEGMCLRHYAFDRYKSGVPKAALTIAVPSDGISTATRKAVQKALKVCEATHTARTLGHEPPNIINPVSLAEYCKRMAKSWGLSCKVIDDKQLARMKANGIVQVGIGSKTPSRLIILTHEGSGGTRTKPVVLVGKAITFDTGGYSLKDKNGIVGMKYDKCGGMAVIGTMHACATAGCKTPVIGVIAAAENMISGEAYRPNDIIRMLNGKTVEIISTDAEGRMVLADSLAYAEKEFKPRCMIDVATLTGGVVVALGNQRAGLMTDDDQLATRLMEAGNRVNEKLWRLPLDDEYLELIRGDDSDLKNSGGRAAHAIIGGMFLKQFVTSKTPWAHLDIAGMGDVDKDTAICPKGATGFGVRLLYDFLSQL